MNKDQSSANESVAVISGSLLVIGGIWLGWAILSIASISTFWPGLVLGCCFTVFIFYSGVKGLERKKSKERAKSNLSLALGGIGAGFGVLILAAFREHDMLMVNMAGVAIAMLLGIGVFTVVMILQKKVGTVARYLKRFLR